VNEKYVHHATQSVHSFFNVITKCVHNSVQHNKDFIFLSFYSPTDAQLNCLKNNLTIYIKIEIKTAPTCFGSITIIRERIFRAW